MSNAKVVGSEQRRWRSSAMKKQLEKRPKFISFFHVSETEKDATGSSSTDIGDLPSS